VSGVVVDTSEWIELLSGRTCPALEGALERAAVVLPPLVAAELVSGARRTRERRAISDLLAVLPLHETPLAHWVRVGELRLHLSTRGVSISTPDAHVAQCALDRHAILLARDRIFRSVARHSRLRLA